MTHNVIKGRAIEKGKQEKLKIIAHMSKRWEKRKSRLRKDAK